MRQKRADAGSYTIRAVIGEYRLPQRRGLCHRLGPSRPMAQAVFRTWRDFGCAPPFRGDAVRSMRALSAWISHEPFFVSTGIVALAEWRQDATAVAGARCPLSETWRRARHPVATWPTTMAGAAARG